MSGYQVIARRFRPQTFAEILGQDAIITTLKNAILFGRLAHAYLFCGSRGTGKTTLARVLAKALNCNTPTDDCEPCNQCVSCKEITNGSSLDVLEIDGASHRGIDDIRQINETVAYSSASGKYKIYIIDEVHMLTKEAFNALLKTLEEPPAKVKFFFATTEPHKVLPTILSRCQRFNLNRISEEKIIQKLKMISLRQEKILDDEAARMIAIKAEGAFRDAESLLDQIFAFHEGPVSAEAVTTILGLMPQEALFALDQAGRENNLNIAFEIVDQLFSQGKDLMHFIEMLTDHFRSLLLVKLSGKEAPFLSLSATEREKYAQSAQFYTREQCLIIIDMLVEAQNQIRFSPSPRIALEALLLRILQQQQRIPIEYLVRRLLELEKIIAKTEINSMTDSTNLSEIPTPPSATLPISDLHRTAKSAIAAIDDSAPISPVIPKPTPTSSQINPPDHNLNTEEAKANSDLIPPSSMLNKAKSSETSSLSSSLTEDPTPTADDVGIKPSKNIPATAAKVENNATNITKQSRYDTLLHFAAVELEGTLQKKITRGN